MFIRDLDDSDNLRAKESAMLGLPYESIFSGELTVGERKIEGRQLKWSVFRDLPAAKAYSIIQEWVFPFIKELHPDKDSAYSKYMNDAIFKIPTPLLLSKIIDSLDVIYTLMANTQEADTKGDVYEYLLSKISQSGLNGQFRTPRHIIRMMVEMMRPTCKDVICDPAMGSAGFIVEAAKYVKEHYKAELMNRENAEHFRRSLLHGFDTDQTMLRIGAMNLMLHDIEDPDVAFRDSLSSDNTDADRYTLILANPPFAGNLDYEAVSKSLLATVKTKKTELLFLSLFLRSLATGGRCASIVPDGVLTGTSNAHKAIRKAIIDGNRLEAVVSMPSGVFKPYSGVSTAILIFTKTGAGGTDRVWFYDMKADGFSLDDKRNPVADNDIPDIIARFHSLDEGGEDNRTRTDNLFCACRGIREHDYDLAFNTYKETVREVVEYEAPEVLIGRAAALAAKITEGINQLDDLINE